MTKQYKTITVTESRNDKTAAIDCMETLEILKLINQEDQKVALAVREELPNIAKAVELITERMQCGGRLIYCGAGTSGRMGIMDAVECVPTFGLDETKIIAIIAGGREAMFCAQEGAEDSGQLCIKDLKAIGLNPKDTLIGIAASGSTPYVLEGIRYARKMNVATIALCCNPACKIANAAELAITPIVGAEVITGSTRMKAGTAQKLVLNMISTAVMIRLGKVYGNLMVDLKATNKKLIERAKRIVMDSTGVNYEAAQDMLEKSHYDVKLAILMIITDIDSETGRQLLLESKGKLRVAIQNEINRKKKTDY